MKVPVDQAETNQLPCLIEKNPELDGLPGKLTSISRVGGQLAGQIWEAEDCWIAGKDELSAFMVEELMPGNSP